MLLNRLLGNKSNLQFEQHCKLRPFRILDAFAINGGLDESRPTLVSVNETLVHVLTTYAQVQMSSDIRFPIIW